MVFLKVWLDMAVRFMSFLDEKSVNDKAQGVPEGYPVDITGDIGGR